MTSVERDERRDEQGKMVEEGSQGAGGKLLVYILESHEHLCAKSCPSQGELGGASRDRPFWPQLVTMLTDAPLGSSSTEQRMQNLSSRPVASVNAPDEDRQMNRSRVAQCRQKS